MKKIFYLIVGLALFGTACKKDIHEFIPNPVTLPSFIVTNIGGTIIDENNEPVEGAEITIQTTSGDVNLTTDQNGIFIANGVEVRQDLAYIKAEVEGYFLGSKSLFVGANTINNVTIKLLERTNIGTIESNIGGTVETEDGAKITFSENGFIDNNGDAYTGTVQVAAKWLDPTAKDLIRIMPGALVGLDANNQTRVLATSGMMAVELTGDNGQELNLGNGAKATLEFPLPSSAADFTFPQTIPLWSFDESEGIWIEEGSAVKEGDRYIGEVTHFSFWNCDAPFDVIHGTGKIVDSEQNPLANVAVQIRINGTNVAGNGWTDASGCYGGLLPKDEILLIEVLDECGDVVTSMEVGPFSQDVTLPTIEVDLDGVMTAVHLVGTLVDCEENPVQNGYIIIGGTNGIETIVFVDANGNFDATVLGCFSDTLSLNGIDILNEKESGASIFDVQPTIDAGTLVACNILNEYIRFTIDGVPYFITEGISGGVEADVVQVYNNLAEPYSASIIWFGTELGVTYNVAEVTLNIPNQQFSNSSLTVTLTELGAVGELMTGEFSGTVLDENDIEHTVTFGEFQIERSF